MNSGKKARRSTAFLLACVMMILSVASFAVAAETTGGWQQDGNNWYYIKDGKKATGWLQVNDVWYWLDENGVMAADKWLDINDHTYYFDRSGAMASGTWLQIKDEWYYFSELGGLVREDFVAGQNNTWYYVDKDGTMVVDEWAKGKDGKTYYLGENGVMVTDKWIAGEKDGKEVEYYVNKEGAMVTNALVSKGNGTAYVDGNGVFDATREDTVTIGGIVYKLSNGMVTGIEDVDPDELATPSNATSVESLLEALDSGKLNDDDAQRVADMIVSAVSNLKDKAVDDQGMAEAMDEILAKAYGLTVENKADDAGGSIEGFGLVAASGYNSNTPVATSPNADKDTIKLVMSASPANALKEGEVIEFRFDLKLEVNGIEKDNLKAPIYLTLTMPGEMGGSTADFTYNLTHNGQKVENANFADAAEGKVTFSVSSLSPFVLTQTRRKSTSTGTVSGGSITGGSSVRASVVPKAGAWVQAADGIRWWYRNADGTWPSNGWMRLSWNGKYDWYYFDAEGYMVTGWITWNGDRYYLHPASDGTQGHMYTGWNLIDGKYYYFRPESGGPQGSLFVNGTTPDGYKVDANGAWIQ